MKKLGQVFIENQRLILDAEPHVMARVRSMFGSAYTYGRGKYTHRALDINFSQSNCRDIMWISDRYPLEFLNNSFELIKEKSDLYEKILEEVSHSDQNKKWELSTNSLKLALPLREHQIKFYNMARKMKRMLLADTMGTGKTASGISMLCEAENRPAIVIVPPHLCSQWEHELKRFLPDITVHMIKGFKNYDLPKVDVILTTYNRLSPWEDKIAEINFKTIIFDEVHELRHDNTAKREQCKLLSERTKNVIGLSGTPIYNRGSEIYSVMDVISPNCLGSRDEFIREWCDWDSVKEPSILNSYLKSKGLMLRRTTKDIGLHFGQCSKHIYTLDSDLEKLKEIQEVAKMLAISVLSGNVGESDLSAREFDYKLRHATGVAKARPVAEFVKMLCDQGEKVVLAGWHRDVYSIWMKELSAYNPVMYTGSESQFQKEESKKKFIEGDSQIFIISLRSGAGLDGLQKVCNTAVFGELDWSPHVMDQVLARVDRDGQTEHVQGFYLTVADGSDPFIMQVLNEKRSQHDGVIEGIEIPVEILEDVGGATKERVKEMAKKFLQSIGEDVPEAVDEVGLLGDLAKSLRKLKITTKDESDMQLAISENLPKLIQDKIEKEVVISKRSRLDFLVTRGNEKIAIECKINAVKKAEVYRQLRRYVEDANITALILFAPWHGVNAFKVDGVPCIVIDTNLNSI